MRVFVGFYTGEYTRALTDNAGKLWYYLVDRSEFDAGWEAAQGGEGDEAAWAAHVRDVMGKECVYTETSGLDIVMGGVILQGNEDSLLEVARRFANVLVEDVQGPLFGGDDTIYDYYPDAIEALFQLCKAIGNDEARELYEATIQTAWIVYGGGDWSEWASIDECFPVWDKEA